MTRTSEVEFQSGPLRHCIIGRIGPWLPPRPVINGGVVNLNLQHVGPVPIRAARRGCEHELVEPESVPHRLHIEDEGMLTICELGVCFTNRPVVLYGRERRDRTEANAVQQAFPFGIISRPIACTVDNGDLNEIYRAEDSWQ